MMTEFKQTPLGKIPKEWRVMKLGKADFVDIVLGQSPPSSTYNEQGEGLPFLQGKGEFGSKYPDPIKYTTQPLKIAEKGDILISVRAPVGDVNLAPFRLCIGRGLSAIRIKKGSSLFYFYFFQRIKRRIESLGKGSTFKAITKNELENLLIPFPPPEEQERIGDVLSSFDDAIQRVDEAIAKTERLKKGLMQKLLTQGIGHKGFKDSLIGRIPENWEYGKLVDFSMTNDSPVQTGPFGAQLHAFDYKNEGVPLILIKNVIDGRIVDDGMPRIAETKASELTRYRLKEGDIVFSRVGSVGRRAVIKKHQEGWLVSGQMLRVRLENPKIDNDFLSYAIASRWFQKALASRTVGATRKSINTEILSNLPMVVPPFPEQQKIVEVLSTIDEKLELDRKRKKKLERIKKGLMNDLLTGKRRVKVAM